MNNQVKLLLKGIRADVEAIANDRGADQKIQPEAKEFPDIEELKKRLAAAQEEIARINCDYYADKQRFVVQRRELEDSRAREKQLRDVLEDIATYPPFEETNNGDRFYEQMREKAQDILDSLYPKEETK